MICVIHVSKKQNRSSPFELEVIQVLRLEPFLWGKTDLCLRTVHPLQTEWFGSDMICKTDSDFHYSLSSKIADFPEREWRSWCALFINWPQCLPACGFYAPSYQGFSYASKDFLNIWKGLSSWSGPLGFWTSLPHNNTQKSYTPARMIRLHWAWPVDIGAHDKHMKPRNTAWHWHFKTCVIHSFMFCFKI